MNLNSVCRLCTETLEQNAMFPLFDGNGDLPAKIKLLTCIQMDAGDGLPSQACEKCVSLLNSFVEFKTLVENSDVSLRRSLRIQDDEVECLQLFVKEENTTNEGTFILSTTIENNEDENDDDDIQEMEDPLLIKEVEGVTVQNGAINNNCETEVEKDTRIDKKQPHPVLQCDFCTRKFSMFQGFMAHMKKHPKMECKICNKIFSTWQTFNNHRQTHADSSGLECPICKKQIKNERGLKRHYRLYHISEISVECDVCKRTFFSEKSLKLHSAIHSEDRRHICTVCNEEFSTGFGLRSHSSTHAMDSSNQANPEANPYECEFCKRRFLLYRSLRCHQRYCKSIQDLEASSPISNQQEIPVMSRSGYECPFCGKTFEELLSFKCHVKSHNRFSKKCTVCSKSFKTIRGLIIHQKIHKSLNTKEIPVDQTFVEDTSINSSEFNDISDEDSRTIIDNFSTLANECKKCKKYFKTERALKIHDTKMHRMQSELHINSPDIQNGESSLTENLSIQNIHNQLPESSFNQSDQQHLIGMENEKTSRVMCTQCNRDFKSADGLKKHIGRMHKYFEHESYASSELQNDSTGLSDQNDQQLFTGVTNKKRGRVMCTQCNGYFKNADGLNKHISKMHKYFQQKSYASSSQLQNGSTESNCNECSLHFKNIRGLKEHNAKVHRHSQDREDVLCSVNENQLDNFPVEFENEREFPEIVHYENFGQVECIDCHLYFKNARALSTHRSHRHKQSSILTPVSRSELYETENCVQFPAEVNCQNTEEVECIECHVYFKNARALSTHRSHRHKLSIITPKSRSELNETENCIQFPAEVNSQNTEEVECIECHVYFKNARALSTHRSHRHKLSIITPKSRSELNETENCIQFPAEVNSQNTEEVECIECHLYFKNARALSVHRSRRHKLSSIITPKSRSELNETENYIQFPAEVNSQNTEEVECIECHLYFKNARALTTHKSHRHKLSSIITPKSHSELNETENCMQFPAEVNSQNTEQVECIECHLYFKNARALTTHKSHRHKLSSIITPKSRSELNETENCIQFPAEVNSQNTEEVECIECHLYFKNARALTTHRSHRHKLSSIITPKSRSELNEAENCMQFPAEVNSQNTEEVECIECHLCFKNARSLSVHRSRRHKLSSIITPKSRSELNETENCIQFPAEVNCQNTEVECIDCHLYFKNARALGVHRSHRHKESSIITAVSRSELYETENYIQLPAEVNHQNTGQVECIECHLYFKNARALSVHRSRRHKQSSIITPESCSELYETENCIQFPAEVNCQNTEEVECIDCHLYFKNARALSAHRSHRHKQSSIITPVSHSELYETENCIEFPAEVNSQNTEEVECSECHLYFKNARALKTHRSHRHRNSSITTSVTSSEMHSEYAEIQNETCLSENVFIKNAAEFECQECKICFKNKRALTTHSVKIHKKLKNNLYRKSKQIECSECKLYFKNTQGLKSHTSKMHKRSDITTIDSYFEVQNYSSENQQNEVECSVCKLNFKSDRALRAHSSQMHGQSSTSVSTTSKTVPIDRNGMKNIQQNSQKADSSVINDINSESSMLDISTNSYVDEYYCEECDKNFETEFGLNVHNGMRHKGMQFVGAGKKVKSLLYNCQLCDKKFTAAGMLIHHAKVHQQENEASSSQVPLNEYLHKEIETCSSQVPVNEYQQRQNDYKCKLCNLKTESLKSFRFHMSIKKHVVPENLAQLPDSSSKDIYECSICGKYYFSQLGFDAHQEKFHKNKVFLEQNHSASSVDNSNNSAEFELIDSTNKSFCCSQCNRSFNTSRDLTRHYTVQHKNIETLEKSPHSVLCDSDSIFKCCNKLFDSQKDLEIHQRHCHGNDTRSSSVVNAASCNIKVHTETVENSTTRSLDEIPADNSSIIAENNKSFTSEHGLNMHCAENHIEKSNGIVETHQNCGSSETSDVSPVFIQIDDEEELHSCSFCVKTFNSEYELNVHCAKIHASAISVNVKDNVSNTPLVNSYQSSTGNKTFDRKRSLNFHNAEVHLENVSESSDRNSLCEIFSDSSSDIIEINEINSYNCALCNESYSNEQELKFHQSKIHSKERCDIIESGNSSNYVSHALNECGEGTSVHHKRKFHQESESDKRAKKDLDEDNTLLNFYRCSLCNLRFGNEINLKIHSSKCHGDELLQEVDNCRNIYIPSNSVQSNEISSVTCSYCDREFMSEDALVLHFSKTHMESDI